MTFLTTSLVLAARSTDPSQYDDGLDWLRLFCEVVTLLWVLVDLGLEVYELGSVMLVFSYTLGILLATNERYNWQVFRQNTLLILHSHILCSHRSLKQHHDDSGDKETKYWPAM